MVDGVVEGTMLEFTPSWAVALVCFSIILIALAVNKILLCGEQLLEKSEGKPFISALQKIKEEMMVMGSMSLLLAVFQTRIGNICISERLANVWLPCRKDDSSPTTAPFPNLFQSSGTRGRSLLAEVSASTDFCGEKGKVPLLSVEALHHLDIFIFVLATLHVYLGLMKILLLNEKIHQFVDPDGRNKRYCELQDVLQHKQQESRGCLASIDSKSKALGWMRSFFKQFYPSVTEFEFLALQLNFMGRDLHKPGEDFQKHMIGAASKDFEKIVGTSWYFWLCTAIFLLLNVAGWHVFFWISFIPLALQLIAGTLLEHMITQLAKDVAQKHSASADCSNNEKSEEDSVVEFRRCYFWFHSPQFVLHLIHVVLLGNSLELALFFFILFQYDFHSCIMEKVGFVVPRIVIGAFVQFMCIYRTLPLYAIMRSQCRDETKIHLKENCSGEEEEMWVVTKIWNWNGRRKSSKPSKVVTHESIKTGSGDQSLKTIEQKKVGEGEVQNKADIEA